ncbi:MAG: hypothetical protein M0Z50_14060 [Planctomycetia bacterium]|nr:hypothetical protein [Planctomycetia bacterium]
MDGSSVVKVETYIEEMREVTEAMLREIVEAVNKAPDGAWINGSEMVTVHGPKTAKNQRNNVESGLYKT